PRRGGACRYRIPDSARRPFAVLSCSGMARSQPRERRPPGLAGPASAVATESVLKQHAIGAWVRRLRTEQRMSLRTLASRTDFSPSFISQVENGVVSPSIASMEKIAKVLGVTLGEFFAASAQGAEGLIVRARERPRISSLWSQARIESLAPTAGRR